MTNSTENMAHPFATLNPDTVIDAVESLGFFSDLKIYPLNSYENRVYQVGIEDSDPVIVKFYRPERWNTQQIIEEHNFTQALHDEEIPVVPPLCINGETLFQFADFDFALFPRKGGRAPDIGDLDSLLILGRLIGRIHAIGAQQPFTARPQLSIASFGHDSVARITEHNIPQELAPAYQSLSHDLLQACEEIWAQQTFKPIRVHGDFHVGNILWRDDSSNIVDLDDARMAPAAQDIWMFLNGDRSQQTAQLTELVDGYEEFFEFNTAEIRLFETLRTLRLMHYSAWLSRRWDDPAFPHNFPWFNTMKYWSEHILMLREQMAALNEAPLKYGF